MYWQAQAPKDCTRVWGVSRSGVLPQDSIVQLYASTPAVHTSEPWQRRLGNKARHLGSSLPLCFYALK